VLGREVRTQSLRGLVRPQEAHRGFLRKPTSGGRCRFFLPECPNTLPAELLVGFTRRP
jgi:hypothetical protein